MRPSEQPAGAVEISAQRCRFRERQAQLARIVARCPASRRPGQGAGSARLAAGAVPAARGPPLQDRARRRRKVSARVMRRDASVKSRVADLQASGCGRRNRARSSRAARSSANGARAALKRCRCTTDRARRSSRCSASGAAGRGSTGRSSWAMGHPPIVTRRSARMPRPAHARHGLQIGAAGDAQSAACAARWPARPHGSARSAGAARNASACSGRITVSPSGFSRPEAILARNLLNETPAEAVSPVSAWISALMRVRDRHRRRSARALGSVTSR